MYATAPTSPRFLQARFLTYSLMLRFLQSKRCLYMANYPWQTCRRIDSNDSSAVPSNPSRGPSTRLGAPKNVHVVAMPLPYTLPRQSTIRDRCPSADQFPLTCDVVQLALLQGGDQLFDRRVLAVVLDPFVEHLFGVAAHLRTAAVDDDGLGLGLRLAGIGGGTADGLEFLRRQTEFVTDLSPTPDGCHAVDENLDGLLQAFVCECASTKTTVRKPAKISSHFRRSRSSGLPSDVMRLNSSKILCFDLRCSPSRNMHSDFIRKTDPLSNLFSLWYDFRWLSINFNFPAARVEWLTAEWKIDRSF